jgi:DNA-binding transcriptional regulator YiaG
LNYEKFKKLDPKTIRNKIGLNLSEMANLMGMREKQYDLWEQGMRGAGGPAYRLLYLLEKDPNEIVAQLS